MGSEELRVEVRPSYHSLPFAVARVILILPLLLLSLLLYLAGLLLILTVVGAIIGIPLILATYALDAIALSILLNPRLKTTVVACPSCGRKKRVLPTVMDTFRCSRCKGLVRLEVPNGEGP